MNKKKLIRKLYSYFPKKIAKKYHDYVGEMVKTEKSEINSIALCLDVSYAVIKFAIENDIDLIISHHPFIYGTPYQVLKDPLKREYYDILKKHNIGVYSFHTNFDEGEKGMNFALAKALNLQNIQPLKECPMARYGTIEPCEIHQFAHSCLEKLNMEYGLLLAYGNPLIKTVCILGGAGSREAFTAYKEGVDLFISGDTPYHIRKEIIEKKLNYLHIDHEVEKIFMPQMKQVLLEIDDNLLVYIVDDVKQAELIVKD